MWKHDFFRVRQLLVELHWCISWDVETNVIYLGLVSVVFVVDNNSEVCLIIFRHNNVVSNKSA